MEQATIDGYVKSAEDFFAWCPKPSNWEEKLNELQIFLKSQPEDKKIAWVTV